ncbi:MAG: hypothetical protein QNJ61_15295 [Desulfobacterales bacterium]|nr:hypothetical protein [Desulfobacterales bacterium]
MTDTTVTHGSVLKTYIVILAMVALILFKGALAFLMVGDQGQPTWDYRPILDVPAESPYAVYQPLPYPQHILGAGGE